MLKAVRYEKHMDAWEKARYVDELLMTLPSFKKATESHLSQPLSLFQAKCGFSVLADLLLLLLSNAHEGQKYSETGSS